MSGPPGAADKGGGILDQAPDFMIDQTRKGCLQELMGCEANSQFRFLSKGQHVAMIDEESSCLMRFFCKGARPWHTRMYADTLKEGRAQGTPLVYEFERPLRCDKGPCKCCCYQEVMARDPMGIDLGTVREAMWFCIPNFGVFDKLDGGNHKYDIHMPTCCGGMCVNCCAQGCCNCRIPFYIYPPNGTEEQKFLSPGSAEVPDMPGVPDAQICKIFRGLGTELFTDADTFEVKCPEDADANDKARLIGATLILNQLFFEKQG